MEFENELYAERLRRKAQAAALASGKAQWTDQLDPAARTKLGAAWRDALGDLREELAEQYDIKIQHRTLRSIAKSLAPSAMNSASYSNDQLLSLIEAQHEVLRTFAEEFAFHQPAESAPQFSR